VSGWKERLGAFDGLGPDDDVYRRAQEGPRRSELPDGPNGPKRLSAAIVAFTVFAAAGVFGWQAFRPGDREPIGPSSPSATITLASTDDGPSANLSYDGAEQTAAFERYVWCTASDECSSGTGEFEYPPIEEGLAIPAGTPIRFEGEGRVERFVVRTPEGDQSSPNVIVDTDGTSASVPDEPGDYLLWIAADWEQGSGFFYLRIRATPADGATSTPTAVDLDRPLRGSGTVLQARDDSVPALCLGGIADSLPPQCDGIPIEGWDWDGVQGERTASGTTWGSYEVVGTYDGATFALIEVLGPPMADGDGGVDFTAPCGEPEGGWVAHDPSRAGRDDFTLAAHAAESESDSTAVWIDYLEAPVGEQAGAFIGVFGFTGDLERHEAELRELWGGPICVFQQATPFNELSRIQRDLGDGGAEAVGLEQTYSDINVLTNVVEIGAIVTSQEIEEALADRYGDGTVTVVPALVPA
jgi:hypothetical protein